jgi:predicted Zn finger-like uncharacterized protein
MYLICPACNARYALENKKLSTGVKKVRCARCKHVWEADLSLLAGDAGDSPAVVAPLPPQKEETVSTPKVDDKTTKKKAAWPSLMIAAKALLAGCRDPKTLMSVFLVAILCFITLFLLFRLFEGPVLQAWPRMAGFYDVIRPVPPKLGAEFDVIGVKAEQRPIDGILSLIVTGVLVNKSEEVVTLPDIELTALGSDNSVVRIWRVERQQKELAGKAKMPFSTKIRYPGSNVADITIAFVEPLPPPEPLPEKEFKKMEMLKINDKSKGGGGGH